jgi:hypothetical protein
MGSHEIIDQMNYDALGLADMQSRYEYPRFLNQQGIRGNFHPRVNKGESIGGVEDISEVAVARKEGQRVLGSRTACGRCSGW